ncbi:Ig-like domain-containing protein [Occallatibacter riparius]|uniref:Ig-like domain-containing protein n=1 Tax=Occallatibacter riparius TaxID=1002689 RepID=A0A9J7BMN6_9BACT|nr:Ig-like domain-containing protein [Occallatibacter riparius]UWZ83018.1 Ig-like domain-containing protein [Occallatibacter riparius]
MAASPLVAADFNHDGHLDLVIVGSNSTNTTVYVLPGNGTGSFGAVQPVFTTSTAGSVWGSAVHNMVIGDFDGDANADIALTAGSSTPTVNFNATAHSWGQLRKMELWVDGKKLAEQFHAWEGNAYFNYASTLASGTHKGTIYAADVDNSLKRFDFNFTVGAPSCSAPSSYGVHICAPANGSTTSYNPVLVSATSKISGTLARMEVWVDGAKKYTETNSTSLAASLNLNAGSHQFTVYAVNTSGTAWKSTVTATVP